MESSLRQWSKYTLDLTTNNLYFSVILVKRINMRENLNKARVSKTCTDKS